MSVSDPLIKELKGHALLLVGIKPTITDDEDSVTAFCDCLERILRNGVLSQFSTFGNYQPPDPWYWLEQMAKSKYKPPFSYQSSIVTAKKSVKVTTNHGRVRLLIRSCLTKRCLHIPVQLLIQSGEYKINYDNRSILGDEILGEILLSVLMHTSRLQFTLDLNNARFLDETWTLPVTRQLQFVPCTELGLSLALGVFVVYGDNTNTVLPVIGDKDLLCLQGLHFIRPLPARVIFVEGKAIVISILPNSIASEEGQIEVGDVLDELNSVAIAPSVQGSLGNILKKASGHPVTAYIIKAELHGQLYTHLVPLLRRADVNLIQLQNRISGCETIVNEDATDKENISSVIYVGKVATGEFGDVKQIRKAIEKLLKEKQEKIIVTFDTLDLGIHIAERKTNKILLQHAYMQISSCGSTVARPNYFAYITDESSTEVKKNCFTCYIFYCSDPEKVDTILNSIGQGFKRTHFAV